MLNKEGMNMWTIHEQFGVVMLYCSVPFKLDIPEVLSTCKSSRLMHLMLCMPCRLTIPFSYLPLFLAISMIAS